jgi:hypothetical protein
VILERLGPSPNRHAFTFVQATGRLMTLQLGSPKRSQRPVARTPGWRCSGWSAPCTERWRHAAPQAPERPPPSPPRSIISAIAPS